MELWFISYFTADKKPAVERVVAATAHAALLKWNELHPELPGSNVRSVFSKDAYNVSIT
jgi:hypothetical protein